jgi:2,3-dimethylmalate lyase
MSRTRGRRVTSRAHAGGGVTSRTRAGGAYVAWAAQEEQANGQRCYGGADRELGREPGRELAVTARLTPRPGGAARLRALLESGQTIVAPGAFDPLAARLVEEAGFPAVYMTGFGTSAALIGRPDVGLLTMTEMVDNAARIAACVDIPVLADADTGYGNPLNVIRTVAAYEAAGVAGIHIEDQVAPKKCGHMEGKLVIPAEEMAAKVRAAVEARTQPEFVIVARTDARAVEGLESALERGRRYRAAGADALFIEAVVTEAEAEEAVLAFPDVPLLFNWAEGGKTPPIGLDRLRELGYRIVIFPIAALLAATAGMRRVLQEIARSGTPAALLPELPSFAEFTRFIGLPEVREAEQRYAVRAGPPGPDDPPSQ